MDRRVEELERLARLRAQGVLTDAEFAAEKARILADESAGGWRIGRLRLRRSWLIAALIGVVVIALAAILAPRAELPQPERASLDVPLQPATVENAADDAVSADPIGDAIGNTVSSPSLLTNESAAAAPKPTLPVLRGAWMLNDADHFSYLGACGGDAPYIFQDDGRYHAGDGDEGQYRTLGNRLELRPNSVFEPTLAGRTERPSGPGDIVVAHLRPHSDDVVDAEIDGAHYRFERCPQA